MSKRPPTVPPQSIPPLTLTRDQQRVLMAFNRMNRKAQEYAVDILVGMAEDFPETMPARTANVIPFRVIQGGAS